LFLKNAPEKDLSVNQHGQELGEESPFVYRRGILPRRLVRMTPFLPASSGKSGKTKPSVMTEGLVGGKSMPSVMTEGLVGGKNKPSVMTEGLFCGPFAAPPGRKRPGKITTPGKPGFLSPVYGASFYSRGIYAPAGQAPAGPASP
jgi:hypothetical protein